MILWRCCVSCDIIEYFVMLLCILWHHWIFCDVIVYLVTSLNILWHHWIFCDVIVYLVTSLNIFWHHWIFCDVIMLLISDIKWSVLTTSPFQLTSLKWSSARRRTATSSSRPSSYQTRPYPTAHLWLRFRFLFYLFGSAKNSRKAWSGK